MAELKTKVTSASVKQFLDSIPDDKKRTDGLRLIEIFEDITGQKGKMWGPSIIGFDQYHYKSERSSQEGDWPMVGFSPRKQSLTLYINSGFEELDTLLAKLGKHKKSVGCLYINKLADVDESVLKEIIKQCYIYMKKLYS